MRFLVLGAVLALAPAAPGGAAADNRPAATKVTACPDVFNQAGGRARVTFRKLTDLPPANAYLAVYRRNTAGCVEPVIAAYGVGASGQRGREAPKAR